MLSDHFFEAARRLIGVSSVATHETESVASMAVQLIESIGLKPSLQQVLHSVEGVSKRQFNVTAAFGDPLVQQKVKRGLLLVSSLDTTDQEPIDLWTMCKGNATDLVRDDGYLYGAGVLSGKLDFLCKLEAIHRCSSSKLKEPVYIMGTCGRFLGSVGMKFAQQSLNVNPRWVIAHAPTQNTPALKGLAFINVQSRIQFQRIQRDTKGFTRRFDISIECPEIDPFESNMVSRPVLDLLRFIFLALEAGFEIRIQELLAGSDLPHQKVPHRATATLFLTAVQFEDFKRFCSTVSDTEFQNSKLNFRFASTVEEGVSFLPENVFFLLLKIYQIIEEQIRSLQSNVVGFEVLELRTKHSELALQALVRLEASNLVGQSFANDINRPMQKVLKSFANVNHDLKVVTVDPGFETDQNYFAKLNPEEIDPSFFAMMSSGGGFWAKRETPVLVYGAGSWKNGHYGQANEVVGEESVERAIAFYERMIREFCL